MTIVSEIETSLPRAGRRFEPIQELELHDAARAAARSLPGASRGVLVVPEFAGPLGVPDFTAYVGPVEWLRERQLLEVPPIVSEVDAAILAVAHVRRPSTVEDLADALGWPESVIAGRMRRLVAVGALEEDRPGLYVRRSAIEPAGRLWAIEAKVGDWQKALQQGRTYSVWADGYVLVMGAMSKRSTAALLEEVRRDRAGLVVDGRWLARPRLVAPSERHRLQAAELFAAATRIGLEAPALAERVHP